MTALTRASVKRTVLFNYSVCSSGNSLFLWSNRVRAILLSLGSANNFLSSRNQQSFTTFPSPGTNSFPWHSAHKSRMYGRCDIHSCVWQKNCSGERNKKWKTFLAYKRGLCSLASSSSRSIFFIDGLSLRGTSKAIDAFFRGRRDVFKAKRDSEKRNLLTIRK